VDRELLRAAADATPRLAWPGAELRRYRDQLFAQQPLQDLPAGWQQPCRAGEALELPAGCGRLLIEPVLGAGLRAPQAGERPVVRLSAAGERLRLPGRAHRHALKDLCQQAGIPPWVRRRLPVLMIGEQVAAVADRWVCADFMAAAGEPGWRMRWVDPPPGYPAATR
jgi:tRNA(Ile)-lysidine synthase